MKFGELNQDSLIHAINEAPTIRAGKFDWVITDVVDRSTATSPYVFGNLSKYSEQGEVTLVNRSKKIQSKTEAPDLLQASAPFVYLPDLSGIAYMHVWNEIEEDVFPRRFKSIIESAYEGFFVDCTLEAIADLRGFAQKIEALEKITELSASVHPTNPLFGRLWEDLDKYVKSRNAEEISVKERSTAGVKTKLLHLIKNLIKNPKWQPREIPSITDAAVLMAVDGYGRGKAVGVENGDEVIVKTSDSKKSFLFDKNPSHEKLAKTARRILEKVSKERDMRH